MINAKKLEPISTSTSLISLIKGQDEEGWRCVTQLYGPLIYHWCRKANLQAADAADIVQDVFRSVLLHVSQFEQNGRTGAFRAWLWTITRNKVRDHIKTHSGKAAAAGGENAYQMLAEIPDIYDSSAGLSKSVKDGTTYRVLNQIRSEVKKVTWDAFWRSTIDGISPALVAEELGTSVPSVWQARSRVLRRARQLLDS